MIIKNYNSTHSLSDYNLGDACTFYIHNLNLDHLDCASKEAIEDYASHLIEIFDDNTYSYNTGKYLNLTRAIGIIVNKYEANEKRDANILTAMFMTNDGRYVLNKYIVNSNDVFTNNKDSVPPTAVLCTV